MKKTKKYEDQNFSHWIAMYDLHQDEWTKESIEQQIELYKGMEGDEEFEELKEEVKQIVANKDLETFLADAKDGIKLQDLEFMASVIVTSE